jgi:O-antigen ligase
MNTETIDRPIKSISKLKYFLIGGLSIFPYFYWFDLKKDKVIKFSLNAFLLTVIIAHLAGFQGMYTGFNWLKMKDASMDRASGLFGQIMTYGYETSWLLVLLVGTFFLKVPWKKYINKNLLYLSLLTSVIGLFLSYCRGAILATMLSIPVLLYFYNKNYFKKSVIACGAIVAVLIIVALSGGSTRSRYFLNATHDSNRIRIAQWTTALNIFKNNPVWGIGFREFSKRSKELKYKYGVGFKEFESHVHNNYLEILANSGLLAFICFLLWMMIWCLELMAMQLYGPLLITMVFSFSVSGFFQSTIIDGENMFFLMNIYGLSTAYMCRKYKTRIVAQEQ